MALNIAYTIWARDKFTKACAQAQCAINSFSSSIESAKAKFKSFNDKIKSTRDGIKKFADFSKKWITLPFVAATATMIKMASDAEETENKFAVVYQDVGEKAEKMAKDIARNYGLSRAEAKTLMGDTGDLLTGFGFTGKAALDLSTKVAQLGVDLASFTNYSGGSAGAVQALTKALLGEREQAKMLGISIMEEDVKRQMQINRRKGLRFETERQAKAYATLDLAMAQSKNAIGDYQRSLSSFANQTREWSAALKDAWTEFGKLILPMATKAITMATKWLRVIADLSPETKKLILIIGAVAAALGPLAIAIWAVTSPAMIMAAAIAAAGLAVYGICKGLLWLEDALVPVVAWFHKLGITIKEWVTDKLNAAAEAFGKVKNWVSGFFGGQDEEIKVEAKKVVESKAEAKKIIERKEQVEKISKAEGMKPIEAAPATANINAKSTVDITLRDKGNYAKSVKIASDENSQINLDKGMNAVGEF